MILRKINIPFQLIIILFLLNTALAFYATPVIDFGDAGTYIEFSKKLLGEKIELNLAHRSPLYSILLALIFKISAIPKAFFITVFLQYGLLFITSFLVF